MEATDHAVEEGHDLFEFAAVFNALVLHRIAHCDIIGHAFNGGERCRNAACYVPAEECTKKYKCQSQARHDSQVRQNLQQQLGAANSQVYIPDNVQAAR